MALEPVEVSPEEALNEELTDMSRRFWWSRLRDAYSRSWCPSVARSAAAPSRVAAR
jgi:hypothetical protein